MGWFLGAGLGFLFGGPLGALVGGALQSFMGKEARNSMPYQSAGRKEEAEFVTYLVSIMTKIALADGHLDKSERQVIHNFFGRELGFSGMDLQFIDGMIEQTRLVNPDLGQIARGFRSRGNREQSLLLLDVCHQIAMADGKITVSEEKELDYLTSYLGIEKEEQERIKNRHWGAGRGRQKGAGRAGGEVLDEALDDYAVLGVTRSSSTSEIKKAYRQMASQYHPDKVSHLGKELIDFAGKKFIVINKAYQAIRKEKGF